jgi:glutamate-ammonia-ligase adenylyltransferase
VSAGRAASATGALARAGFADTAGAHERLAQLSLDDVGREKLLEDLSASADPDQALAALVELPEPDRQRVIGDERLRASLCRVCGASAMLGRHLARHPEHLRVLVEPGVDGDAMRRDLLDAVGSVEGPMGPVARGFGVDVLDDLRVAYRRWLLAIAVADLVHEQRFDEVSRSLADLADATLEAGLAVARSQIPADSEPCRLSVIAMGKCGGQELNYISDVDVIFVAEPVATADGELGDEVAALKTATKLAAGLIRVCGEHTAEGSIWEVDAALRPEGKAGALVRTLASHIGYYQRWATTWEFQALLKARPAAGDRDLGEAYVDAIGAEVWEAAGRPDFVVDVQRMRRRVEEHVPARDAERQLKLGRGGLRDVEFSVQLLQLVHGRSDVMVRSPTTLTALESLATWGYVGREDGATLASAYRFLRTLEHRIQLQDLRRTHVVPEGEQDLRRLGRSMGFRRDPVVELTAEWNTHAREVRRIHEKLFYRPLLQAVARLEPGEARLTPEAAAQRLQALGYADPAGALRHLEALTSGVSRRAAIQRTLLPVLLGWFANGADPDAALLDFRRMSEDLGSTPWYLRLLRDESAAAERMAMLMSSSRYASDLLLRSPDAVAILADEADITPRSADQLRTEIAAALARHEGAEPTVAAVRAIRRRELFRISAADIVTKTDPVSIMRGISDVTEVAIEGALQAAIDAVAAQRGGMPTRIAVIGMGRFGGGELGYGSDADVMFVHDPLPGADDKEATDAAQAVANELRRLLSVPSVDPPLDIDADLRPEGRQGPLVRTLASYAAYYDRWSSPWEAQALLRGRFIAGDVDLGHRFITLIDPLRWPDNGLTEDALREMRRLKARMESERLPRGADPTLHTKLGRGGLADVEWVAQLLQLQHAAHVVGLRTTGTIAALDAAVAAELLAADDREELVAAWLMATRVRNAIVLARGKAGDLVPSAPPDLTGVAHLLGYGPGHGSDLLEDYRRVTRRARAVVERVFYEN